VSDQAEQINCSVASNTVPLIINLVAGPCQHGALRWLRRTHVSVVASFGVAIAPTLTGGSVAVPTLSGGAVLDLREILRVLFLATHGSHCAVRLARWRLFVVVVYQQEGSFRLWLPAGCGWLHAAVLGCCLSCVWPMANGWMVGHARSLPRAAQLGLGQPVY
jgi:hypothetical protein